jgi:hypothetical protein
MIKLPLFDETRFLKRYILIFYIFCLSFYIWSPIIYYENTSCYYSTYYSETYNTNCQPINTNIIINKNYSWHATSEPTICPEYIGCGTLMNYWLDPNLQLTLSCDWSRIKFMIYIESLTYLNNLNLLNSYNLNFRPFLYSNNIILNLNISSGYVGEIIAKYEGVINIQLCNQQCLNTTIVSTIYQSCNEDVYLNTLIPINPAGYLAIGQYNTDIIIDFPKFKNTFSCTIEICPTIIESISSTWNILHLIITCLMLLIIKFKKYTFNSVVKGDTKLKDNNIMIMSEI